MNRGSLRSASDLAAHATRILAWRCDALLLYFVLHRSILILFVVAMISTIFSLPAYTKGQYRQLDICTYEISFAPGRSTLDHIDIDTIDEAAREVSRTGSHHVETIIRNVCSYVGSPELATARIEAIAQELVKRGVAKIAISDVYDEAKRLLSPFDCYGDRLLERPNPILLSVCDLPRIRYLEGQPLEDRNATVDIIVARSLIRLPVRFLGPRIWSLTRDADRLPIEWPYSVFRVGWPGMIDQTDQFVRLCNLGRNDCHNTITISLRELKNADDSRINPQMNLEWGSFDINDEKVTLYSPSATPEPSLRFSIPFIVSSLGVRDHGACWSTARLGENPEKWARTSTCTAYRKLQNCDCLLAVEFNGILLGETNRFMNEVSKALESFPREPYRKDLADQAQDVP